jgi:hypothetical protein
MISNTNASTWINKTNPESLPSANRRAVVHVINFNTYVPVDAVKNGGVEGRKTYCSPFAL